ncbi:MAG: DnaA/Hda family protein [Candidatus Saliniplasma sp.]
MSRKKFPEGLKIQDKKGPGKLSKTLEKLEKYSFRGYIRVTVDEELEGYITLKDGTPKNALLYTPSDMEISGEDAYKKILSLDDKEELYLEVHTKVDIDKLIKDVGGQLDENISEQTPDFEEDVIEMLEQVGDETKSLQETVSEETEEEISAESKEIEEQITRDDMDEKELEVYDMIIKERQGKKIEDSIFPERYTFDNFVVGENNKLAYVASREVARGVGRSFNPLVLTSGSGMGKTHLLKAIGHYTRKNHPELDVVYSTTENCTADLIQSLKDETSKDVREKYYDTDLLLLDDIQFLAGREKHQEIIFYLFNHLTTEGRQIIFTCDRPPEEIPDIKERLVSRFKSGLVISIDPPPYENRLKIIERKIEQKGVDVPVDVKEFLATHITKNVREIEGAINRLLAFSSLLNEEITLETVKKSFRNKIESEEEGPKADITNELEPGISYIIEEERPDKGFRMLEDLLRKENQIYIISRLNPNRILKEYSLDGAEMYWLTGRDSENLETIRPNLESITYRLEEIIDEGKVILLDGIEYLISNTGFDATIQFLRHMIDIISETDSLLLITVSPSALKERQISILEREMEVLSTEDLD